MSFEIERSTLAAGSVIRRMVSTKPPMTACTIVARNYLAQAEVLAASFKRYHPDCSFAVLVVDETGQQSSRQDGVELLTLADIGLDPGDAYRMPMIYNVTELSTAVKPWLLRRFLNGTKSPVIYFDPDIEIFAPLYDLGELTRKHSIVLTPHVTEPLPQDALRLSESDILGSGIYNLGFIAVGPKSEPFLDWWAARLRRESVIDPTRMRFTDQRWIDFVPGLFEHYILRDPAFNVAYWNLHSRVLARKGDSYTVNGKQLRFFHFSGYNPDFPHVLSKHQGDKPRVLLSQHPGVARICKEYRKNLLEFGFDKTKRHPYRFDKLSNGLTLDFHIRKLYREALNQFENDEGPEPPSPFAPEGEEPFLDWLNEPMRPAPPLVTRFMMAIYAARPDLQVAFPDPLGAKAEAFHNWFLEYGQFEQAVHKSLVPGGKVAVAIPPNDAQESHESVGPVVNVAGYLRAELGIGEAARLLLAGLESAKIATTTLSYDVTLNRQDHPFEDTEGKGSHIDINIVCVNADQTPVFGQTMGPNFFQGRYTAGVWFWEIEDFPDKYRPAFDYVDEVWVATEFMRQALIKVAPKPVFKFHLPIVKPPIDPGLSRSDLGLPKNFCFLFSFDFLSIFERKNPMGVITAFKRAFKAGEGPTLLIKTINGDKRILDAERLKLAAGARSDIIIADGYLSPVEKNSLMAQCDCYVSLHRSEGYGLTMAEAMAFGKPVIATGYSGNLEFMTPDNSYLCSYEYCEIGEGANPYPPTSHWAQPNLDEAAEYMRGVYFNRDEAMARGLRAADDVRTLHSPAVAGAAVADRLLSIRARRARFGKILPAEVIESRLEALEAAPRTVLRISEQDKIERAKLSQLVGELQVTMRQLAGQFEGAQRAIKEHSEKLDDSKLESQLNQMSQINAKVVTAEQTLTSTAKQLEQHLKRLMTVESETGRLQGLVPDLRAEAERLERLDSTLETLTKEVGRITRHMDALPFMSDPRVLHTEDPHGRPILGYHEADSDGPRSDLYIGFENIFRGSEEMIRERQRGYLEVIGRRTPVLDLGCGRGEMLDLLKEKQIAAVGVDQNPGMIARAAAKGHKVERKDIIEYLAEQPEHSIGAIFCAQVIEHLPHEKLIELLKLARGKLKPDGLLILETINPHSHRALKTFWVDPTHNKPIFPEVLMVLCKETGYPEAIVHFPCGTGNFETDRLSEGEYAVVAKTAAVASTPGRANNSRQKKTKTSPARRSLHA